jgi:hypothetical protein
MRRRPRSPARDLRRHKTLPSLRGRVAFELTLRTTK